MTTIFDDEWMSLRQFCDLVDWNVATAHNRISRGDDFPVHYKVGKKIRIRKADAAEWLAQQRRVPAAVQLRQQATA